MCCGCYCSSFVTTETVVSTSRVTLSALLECAVVTLEDNLSC